MTSFAIAGLIAASTVPVSAISVVTTDPGLYDFDTAQSIVTARGRSDTATAGSWKSAILKGGTAVTNGGVQNGPNPWVTLNGTAHKFSFSYNATTGQTSLSLLGRTPTAVATVPAGTSLAGFRIFNRIQTPTGNAANTLSLTGMNVAVNGGAGQALGDLSVSANQQTTTSYFFNQFGAESFTLSGFVTFTSPEAWNTAQEGTSFNITAVAAEPIPEPATMLVLGAAAGAVALRRRRNA